MAFRKISRPSLLKCYSTSPTFVKISSSEPQYQYEMPNKYSDKFFLANASLLDDTNWFLHRAFEVVYPNLIEEAKAKGHGTKCRQVVENFIESLTLCNNLLEVNFPVKMQNGIEKVFKGYRAQHGITGDVPYMGGLRFTTDELKDTYRGIALQSCLKHSCFGIDMAGAHGGICIDPGDFTKEEVQNIVQKYALYLIKKRFCGESEDVFEPNIGCGSAEMEWIVKTDASESGNEISCCASGKPVDWGGIEDQKKSAGMGIFFGLDAFLQNGDVMKKIGLDVGWSGKTFIIEGLGKVGAYVAGYLSEVGLTCVGIKEKGCYLHDPDGVNVKHALMHFYNHHTLCGFSKTKPVEGKQIFTEDCDILVLAALHKTLPCYCADNVKAKIIVEAAHDAVTPSAHKILAGHSKLVIPDLYINGGSSVASYYEYLIGMKERINRKLTQSFTNDGLTKLMTEVEAQDSRKEDLGGSPTKLEVKSNGSFTETLDAIMGKVAKDIMEIVVNHNLGLDFKTAAYINGIRRLFSLHCAEICE